MNQTTHTFRYILLGFLFATIIIALERSYFVVQPGFAALQIRMGDIIRVCTQSGFYMRIPFIDSVVKLDQRISKAEIETPAMSRDLQSVQVGMVVNYKINNVIKLYQEIGTDFLHIIIDPYTQESVKAVIAKFTAEDLIQSRHEAKDKVIHELSERLNPRYITLIDFNFIHLDFSQDFIKAVEEKQIAEQRAKTAKNLTEKVKEEANQIKARAEAEAFSLRAKKESVTKELIMLQQVEAQMKAIEKWDGVLPRVTSGTLPLFNLDHQITA